jgi:hypothetical protein
MSKAILEFDLNDSDDRMEHLRCVKSTDMALLIWDILYNTKKSLIYKLESDNLSTDREHDLIESIWEELWDRANEKGIKIDELIN